MKLEVFDPSTGKGNIEGIKSKRKKELLMLQRKLLHDGSTKLPSKHG